MLHAASDGANPRSLMVQSAGAPARGVSHAQTLLGMRHTFEAVVALQCWQLGRCGHCGGRCSRSTGARLEAGLLWTPVSRPAARRQSGAMDCISAWVRQERLPDGCMRTSQSAELCPDVAEQACTDHDVQHTPFQRWWNYCACCAQSRVNAQHGGSAARLARGLRSLLLSVLSFV